MGGHKPGKKKAPGNGREQGEKEKRREKALSVDELGRHSWQKAKEQLFGGSWGRSHMVCPLCFSLTYAVSSITSILYLASRIHCYSQITSLSLSFTPFPFWHHWQKPLARAVEFLKAPMLVPCFSVTWLCAAHPSRLLWASQPLHLFCPPSEVVSSQIFIGWDSFYSLTCFAHSIHCHSILFLDSLEILIHSSALNLLISLVPLFCRLHERRHFVWLFGIVEYVLILAQRLNIVPGYIECRSYITHMPLF